MKTKQVQTKQLSYTQDNTFFQEKKMAWVGLEPTTLCMAAHRGECVDSGAVYPRVTGRGKHESVQESVDVSHSAEQT